jgi:hypothetical protein
MLQLLHEAMICSYPNFFEGAKIGFYGIMAIERPQPSK